MQRKDREFTARKGETGTIGKTVLTNSAGKRADGDGPWENVSTGRYFRLRTPEGNFLDSPVRYGRHLCKKHKLANMLVKGK